MEKRQRRTDWWLGGAMTALTLSIFVVVFGPARSARANAEQSAKVERGRYLVEIMACHDCHTPKKMGPNGPEFDRSRELIGHPEGDVVPPPPALPEGPWAVTTTWDLTAWSGPWGVSYPFNLTPDENTGLGIWTEEMFFKAMRSGRHMGTSRPILPPMPWQIVGSLSDDDLSALFAFLKSLPPVHNRVPAPVILEPPAATE